MCTQSVRGAHQNPRRTRVHALSHPNISPPCPSAFTATIELAKLGAVTLAKRRPWYNSIARGPSVQNIGRLDTRLMTASSSCAHAPALTAQGWGGRV